jgi:DNA-binding transcriptional LysR family regulator
VSPNSWAGVGAVFPNVEVRHLHAVIALGEELHFTKAALRLNLTQSALSRQITEIEKQLRFRLFTRDNRRVVRVELTDAGQVFVAEARSSLLHMERAFHLARTTHDGAGNFLTIGHSHEADQAWVSDLLAVRLPLYPKLAIRLISQFSIELVRSVLAGELNLALVTAPPKDSQIEASPFVLTPLYAVLPESHAAAEKEQLVLQDLEEMNGFCSRAEFIPSFRWTRLDVRESLRNAGTTSLRRKKRFTWCLSTSEWPFSRNLRPLAFAPKV